eukprot:1717618-Rhodomonas_salina.2
MSRTDIAASYALSRTEMASCGQNPLSQYREMEREGRERTPEWVASPYRPTPFLHNSGTERLCCYQVLKDRQRGRVERGGRNRPIVLRAIVLGACYGLCSTTRLGNSYFPTRMRTALYGTEMVEVPSVLRICCALSVPA